MAADPFAKSLGIELVSAHTDRVELVMPTAKDKTNFLEVIHGGVLFSLADVVLSLLSNACGTTALAISTQLNLYRPTRAGLPISAVGVPIQGSCSLATYRVELHQAERLVGTFQGTVFFSPNFTATQLDQTDTRRPESEHL